MATVAGGIIISVISSLVPCAGAGAGGDVIGFSRIKPPRRFFIEISCGADNLLLFKHTSNGIPADDALDIERRRARAQEAIRGVRIEIILAVETRFSQ